MDLINTKFIPATERDVHRLRSLTGEHQRQSSHLLLTFDIFIIKRKWWWLWSTYCSHFYVRSKICIVSWLIEKTRRQYKVHVFSFNYFQWKNELFAWIIRQNVSYLEATLRRCPFVMLLPISCFRVFPYFCFVNHSSIRPMNFLP
jgi:hypothetical protein